MNEENEHIVFVVLLCLLSAMLYESFYSKFQSKFFYSIAYLGNV